MCARNVYLPKDKSPYTYRTSLFLCRPRAVSGFRKKLLPSGNNETIASRRTDILPKFSLSASQQTPLFLWKPTVFNIFAAVQMRNPLWCDTTLLALKDECSRLLRNVGIGLPRDAISYPELAHCPVYNDPPLGPVLRQVSPAHVLPSHFFKVNFNIILLSTPSSSLCSLFFTFPSWNSACISRPFHTYHMPCPSHPPWENTNKFWLQTKTMKQLIT